MLGLRGERRTSLVSCIPPQGIADAEIKIPSAENPALSKFLSCALGVGENIALRASPAAEYSALLIFALPVRLTPFS